ncbi:glycosyltransferase family A protein, partial [Nocardioides sp.]|uniref:glycosyltransferase family 2 protein n=1 Tax=Nocardioides sp. TaxID=35761 RepID=UPI00273279CD
MTGRARAGAARLGRWVPKPLLRGAALLVRRGSAVSVVVVLTDDNVFFLDECIDSLGRQQRRADEILLVVTGTTSFTVGAARRQARASHRVRLVPAAGMPLAGARERGVAAARGDHVLVHDGGDLLTEGALAALAGALDRTGSDLVVGGQPRSADRVDLRQAPEVLAMVRPGVRMVRRAAWSPAAYDVAPALERWLPGVRSVVGSPPGTLRFDTVTDPVNRGLERGTGLAFGAMRRLAGEVSRLDEAVRAVLADLDAADARSAGDVLVSWLLAEELPAYLDDAERCDDHQWQTLRALARDLLERAEKTGGLLGVPVAARVRAWLATQDRREDLAAFALTCWQQEQQLPTEVVDGRLLALPGVPVPDPFREVGPGESPLRVVVRRATRTAQGHLDVELLTIVPGLGAACGPATVSVGVAAHGAQASEPARVERVADPEANVIAGERFADHSGRSFRV